MAELTLNQITRIKRVELSRNHKAKRELTPGQRHGRIIAWFGLGIALLILAALFMVAAEWQPGNQAQIAAEYRALRHEAIAMRESK